jgi:hypothetical protein
VPADLSEAAVHGEVDGEDLVVVAQILETLKLQRAQIWQVPADLSGVAVRGEVDGEDLVVVPTIHLSLQEEPRGLQRGCGFLKGV